MQRRIVREADQIIATTLERLVHAILFTPQERWSEDRITAAYADIGQELAVWEPMPSGEGLDSPLSAAAFTLFPHVALMQRIGNRKPARCGCAVDRPQDQRLEGPHGGLTSGTKDLAIALARIDARAPSGTNARTLDHQPA